jgi:hypothetical protein
MSQDKENNPAQSNTPPLGEKKDVGMKKALQTSLNLSQGRDLAEESFFIQKELKVTLLPLGRRRIWV